jgi:shikimate 5-dehydrogenase
LKKEEMTMRNFPGIAAAADAARACLIGGSTGLPDGTAEKLAPAAATGGSPVDLTVGFAEAVYANSEAASEEAREIAAGCAVLAETFGFHGLNQDGRGSRMALVLDGQDIEEAPEPKDEWAAPSEEAKAEPASQG